MVLVEVTFLLVQKCHEHELKPECMNDYRLNGLLIILGE
jgi:hypothetical protein